MANDLWQTPDYVYRWLDDILGRCAKMTNEEYIAIQHQLMVMAQIINQMDLTKFLERIETTHAVGPILDPTLYRKGIGKMTLVQRVAEAALKFQKVTKEVLSEIERLEGEKNATH